MYSFYILKQMSVVSSRVNSVSSILKGPGVREQYIKQSKIFFKLPNDIKGILCNFETGNDVKEYEKLIQILREGAIKVRNEGIYKINLKIIFYIISNVLYNIIVFIWFIYQD